MCLIQENAQSIQSNDHWSRLDKHAHTHTNWNPHSHARSLEQFLKYHYTFTLNTLISVQNINSMWSHRIWNHEQYTKNSNMRQPKGWMCFHASMCGSSSWSLCWWNDVVAVILGTKIVDGDVVVLFPLPKSAHFTWYIVTSIALYWSYINTLTPNTGIHTHKQALLVEE